MTTAAASVEMSAILVLICIDNASMLDSVIKTGAINIPILKFSCCGRIIIT